MRLLLVSLLLVMSNSFQSHAIIVKNPSKGTSTLNVYFDSDKSILKDDEKTKVDQLMKDQSLETLKITLVGHTDSQGDDDYNTRLSKSRVEAVKKYLVKLGYDPDVIEIDYRGESDPVAKNEVDEGRAQNRRVSLEWEYKDPEPIEETGDIRDLYKLLEQVKQEFCIDPNRDTILSLDHPCERHLL